METVVLDGESVVVGWFRVSDRQNNRKIRLTVVLEVVLEVVVYALSVQLGTSVSSLDVRCLRWTILSWKLKWK